MPRIAAARGSRRLVDGEGGGAGERDDEEGVEHVRQAPAGLDPARHLPGRARLCCRSSRTTAAGSKAVAAAPAKAQLTWQPLT